MAKLKEALTLDEKIADTVAKFYADPLGFVLMAYDWKKDPDLHVVKLVEPWSLIYDSEWGPDKWACEFLDDLGAMIRANKFDGKVPVKAVRMSVGSGHGIGKSALAAWLVNFIMSTRPLSHGTVTANTSEQLSSKTWAEVAKWTKRCITGHWFEISTGKGAMRMVSKSHPHDWFCVAQTCREENSEAFAGQHAPTATSFYVFDESGGVPEIIDEVSEGGLTDGEPMKFAFGNITRNVGWFVETFTGSKWKNRHIDSRDVQITNKVHIQEMIDEYGIDSNIVKVRVRGMAPSMSMKQFISTEDVDKALGRILRIDQYDWAPKILTCDPAWEGDDELVIGMRQGLLWRQLAVMAKNDNDVVVANKLMRLEDEHKADAVFVDAGYGTGIVSVGKTLGRSWTLVWFAAAPSEPGCLNKRAEMWKDMRDWLKAGGAIPNDSQLYKDLVGPETVPRLDGVIQLEGKKDMKRRRIASPNRADALALSFAYPVISKALAMVGVDPGAPNTNSREYDPYASASLKG